MLDLLQELRSQNSVILNVNVFNIDTAIGQDQHIGLYVGLSLHISRMSVRAVKEESLAIIVSKGNIYMPWVSFCGHYIVKQVVITSPGLYGIISFHALIPTTRQIGWLKRLLTLHEFHYLDKYEMFFREFQTPLVQPL